MSEKSCPSCGDTQGFTFTEIAETRYEYAWGGPSLEGDFVRVMSRSLCECMGCGTKFRWATLVDKDLV